jgi:hypothetical protein
MYGVATTFYTMLTGNPPDKMGRTAFRWPPQGEVSLSQSQKSDWLRFHSIIRRAIDDRPAERFIDFKAFSRALNSSGEELPSKLEPAEFPLQSEIRWVTVSMVLGSLKICGFKQIAQESGLLVFNKKMKEEDIPQGVSVALHYDTATNAVWTYRCLRVSTNETLKFDNQAFEEGIAAICGIFLADKEWSDIHKFIYRPKNAMREVRFKEEKMTFRDAHLSADCELVFESDDSSTLLHAFAVSSRE